MTKKRNPRATSDYTFTQEGDVVTGSRISNKGNHITVTIYLNELAGVKFGENIDKHPYCMDFLEIEPFQGEYELSLFGGGCTLDKVKRYDDGEEEDRVILAFCDSETAMKQYAKILISGETIGA